MEKEIVGGGLEALSGEVRDGAGDHVLRRAGGDGEHGQAAVLELLEPQLVEVRLRPGKTKSAKNVLSRGGGGRGRGV